MSAGLSKEDLELLRKYDTPTVCNAIECFKVRPQNTGYMGSRIKCNFPEMPPMVGYASTATYRSDLPSREGDVYETIDNQVDTFKDLPGPTVVVYQDLDDPPVAATFGDVMCSCFQAFGAVGLVTSGGARDLEQVRELGFQTFSSGAICAHAYSHTLEINGPVRVGGITVFAGDLIHGDANGVTTIPNDIASEMAHVLEDYAAAEAVVLNYAKSGSVTPKGLGEARAECKRMIDAIAERVAKK